jgi:hypothetical protein
MDFLSVNNAVDLATNKTIKTCEDYINGEPPISYNSFWIFLIVGLFVCVASLLVIYTFYKVEECRTQPGDLFLMISIANFVMSIHWVVTALGSKWSWFTSDTWIFNSSTWFC